jgi:hypothetical protein
MDCFLTILFYVYLGLAVSTPLLIVPAIVLCHKTCNPLWKSLAVIIPVLGLPLFCLALDLPRKKSTHADFL